MASLARIKRYQDTIKRQADELASWNKELESRVEAQVSQLERMGRLRRFLSPQLAELIVDSGDESFLESHRREIVVVFCDLRGFTPFAEASEPEEVMGVLAEYHQALGDLIFRFEGTLERFTGDGLMVFFNDPVRCDDGPLRAIRMSVAMRTRVRGAGGVAGRDRGTTSALGIGDRPGLRDAGPDRLRRSASTTPRSGASRTSRRGSAPTPKPWQILVTERVFAAAGSSVVGEDVGSRELRGFSRTVHAFSVKGIDELTDGRHDRRPLDRSRRRPTLLSDLSEEERYRRFDELQARMAASGTRCGSTTTTSRSSSSRRSRSTGPSRRAAA